MISRIDNVYESIDSNDQRSREFRRAAGDIGVEHERVVDGSEVSRESFRIYHFGVVSAIPGREAMHLHFRRYLADSSEDQCRVESTAQGDGVGTGIEHTLDGAAEHLRERSDLFGRGLGLMNAEPDRRV